MGTAFKIRCKHCSTLLNHSTNTKQGYFAPCIGNGKTIGYVETETSMRCPVCLRRLNATPEEFNQQVEANNSWQ